MGVPSMSIMLHEVTKILHYAGVQKADYIRIGSSGGIGVPPGTVVITRTALNGELEPFLTLTVLGKPVRRAAHLSAAFIEDLLAVAEPGIAVVVGATVCADDFYEGQGRTDGAICEHSPDERRAFLQRARQVGVLNIEMESLVFAAFTMRLGIRATVLCATYVNRLESDQITASHETLDEYSDRPQRLAIRYMRKQLGLPVAPA